MMARQHPHRWSDWPQHESWGRPWMPPLWWWFPILVALGWMAFIVDGVVLAYKISQEPS